MPITLSVFTFIVFAEFIEFIVINYLQIFSTPNIFYERIHQKKTLKFFHIFRDIRIQSLNINIYNAKTCSTTGFIKTILTEYVFRPGVLAASCSSAVYGRSVNIQSVQIIPNHCTVHYLEKNFHPTILNTIRSITINIFFI